MGNYWLDMDKNYVAEFVLQPGDLISVVLETGESLLMNRGEFFRRIDSGELCVRTTEDYEFIEASKQMFIRLGLYTPCP